MRHFKLLNIVLIVSALGLSACWGDDEDKGANVRPAQKIKHDYDFLRTLKINCDDFPCAEGSQVKMKMSDYNSDLLDFMGLSIGDDMETVRNKFDKNRYRSAFESLSSVHDKTYILKQLADFNNPNKNHYDIFVRFDDSEKAIEWGARVRCAPVTETTPWQTTPC